MLDALNWRLLVRVAALVLEALGQLVSGCLSAFANTGIYIVLTGATFFDFGF